MLVMSATLPLAQVKSKFSEMIDRVEQTQDRIVVSRAGEPERQIRLMVSSQRWWCRFLRGAALAPRVPSQ